MKRRHFLMLGLGGAATLGWRYWPEDGFTNTCPPEGQPPQLLQHPLVREAMQGLDFSRVWDNHVHLIGAGNRKGHTWVNPEMQSLMHPLKLLQYQFYMNASCVGEQKDVDQGFVDRLYHLLAELPLGMKAMLLAFDYYHDASGQVDKSRSAFYTSNEYAASIATRYADRLEWVASIHPYREDSIDQLEIAHQAGAKAVKWLPGAMGINPADGRCKAFYNAMHRLNMPLLSHVGHEMAVATPEGELLGNPLLLRKPMEYGVRVIMAHAASLGASPDLDKGGKGKDRDSFDLFVRMMNEPEYENLLFADISAILQLNRLDEPVKYLLLKEEWHNRIINGSDYPLPGILPLFPLKTLRRAGLIREDQYEVLRQIRNYNPIWFDFVLKRMLRWQGKQFANTVFETRRHFI